MSTDPDRPLHFDQPEELVGSQSASAGNEADTDDPRLLTAVQEYLAVLESGGHPSRQAWLDRYPEIASQLSVYLDGLSFVHSAAAQVRGDHTTGRRVPPGPGVDLETESGKPLGDFQLLREIGRGGMGVVYEALQLSLGRRVAVKVLPLASSLDGRQLQRFKHEAQAAAQLHHTNIVPVYAVGCERSVHFYAMQLIDGQSLADVVATLRRTWGRLVEGNTPSDDDRTAGIPADSGTAILSDTYDPQMDRRTGVLQPKSAMGSVTAPGSADVVRSLHSSKGNDYFRAVARLGLQAAGALDYAHGLGVVHRDIKPANLLLDERGTLWVTDFGLAQIYTDVSLTQPGDLVGTLRYMSPEQASGRAVVLDQRTDIYSLGITLYELLTLERALPGRTREQLLYEIGYVDPPLARSINKAVPTELETIVAKAIAKDPAERYSSARALADDLQRFLSDEPIRARPPTLWNKTIKWTRRHRALSLAALVMLLMAAVGLLVSTLLIAREQTKTKNAYLREREQHTRAEKSFSQARAQVDFLARVAAEELADDPLAAEVRKEMLQAALDYYQEFLEDHRDDKLIGEELTEAQSHVASILTELSAFESFDRVQTWVRLLTEPSVRDALKLSTDQVAKVQEFNFDFPGRFFRTDQPRADSSETAARSPDGRSAKSRRKSFALLASEVETALDAMITPAQSRRLREISRQVRGPVAFSDPDAITALGLNLTQKDSVRRLQSESRKALRELSRHYGFGKHMDDMGGDGEHSQWVREQFSHRILAQLNPTQTETWKMLVGEPFTGKVSIDRSHGPGPNRPPQSPNRDRPPGTPNDRRSGQGSFPGGPSPGTTKLP